MCTTHTYITHTGKYTYIHSTFYLQGHGIPAHEMTTQDSQGPAQPLQGFCFGKTQICHGIRGTPSSSYQPMILSHTVLENSLHSHSKSALLFGYAP